MQRSISVWSLVIYILFLIALLSGCSSQTTNPSTAIQQPLSKSANQLEIKQSLYTQYKEWKGVGYRIGGLYKSGIDCSGFAYVTFRSKLGITLPRTTEEQARRGIPVKKSELKAGDLIFLKTGRTIRHVGMYLENGKFLHASTSKGVIISSINNVYWKSRYWKARRIRQ